MAVGMDATESERPPERFLLRLLRAVAADLRARDSPVTTAVVGLVALLFAQQAAAAVLSGVAVQTVAGHLFLEDARRAWLLSFFLHRNLLHFGTNVVLIWFLGRVVEGTVSRRAYALFVVSAATASVVGGYLFTTTFTDGPIAVYGASGLGFALATYALVLPLQTGAPPRVAYRLEHLLGALSPAEELAVLIGGTAVLHVLLDVATGPFFTAHWINGGHAVGAAAGVLAGLASWRLGRR